MLVPSNSSLNIPGSRSIHLVQANHSLFSIFGTPPATRGALLLSTNHIITQNANSQCPSESAQNHACLRICPNSCNSTAEPGTWPSGRPLSLPGRAGDVHFALSRLDFVHVAKLLQILKPRQAQLFPQEALACCVLHCHVPFRGLGQLAICTVA